VIDPDLVNPLNLTIELSALADYGVERLFLLSSGIPDTAATTIVFLVRPTPRAVQQIANSIHGTDRFISALQACRDPARLGLAHLMPSSRLDYHVVFTPQVTLSADQLLKDAGVYGDLSDDRVHAWEALSWVPLDPDETALCAPDAFRSVYVDGDTGPLFQTARALLELQKRHGAIPLIRGHGHAARIVARTLHRLAAEADAAAALNARAATPDISRLIIIDRSSDPVTPLLTQLTYQGLLDDLFGISGSICHVRGPENGQGEAATARVICNTTDRLWPELRDKNFSAVPALFAAKSQEVQAVYDKRQQLRDSSASMTDVQRYMKLLAPTRQLHQALQLHSGVPLEAISARTATRAFFEGLRAEQALVQNPGTAAVALALDRIEEMICDLSPLDAVLRLACLTAVTSGGLKPKTHDKLKRDIVHSYGYPQLFTVLALERAGLLPRRGGGTAAISPYVDPDGAKKRLGWFEKVRRPLRLCVPTDEKDPEEPSYVYSGYCPVSVRLVEALLTSPLNAATDAPAATDGPQGVASPSPLTDLDLGAALRILPDSTGASPAPSDFPAGLAFEMQQPSRSLGGTAALPAAVGAEADAPTGVALVLFIGGHVAAEASALRFLTQQAVSGKGPHAGAPQASGLISRGLRGRARKLVFPSDVVIASTGGVSGAGLMRQLMETVTLGAVDFSAPDGQPEALGRKRAMFSRGKKDDAAALELAATEFLREIPMPSAS
jgi:hypothetical protein